MLKSWFVSPTSKTIPSVVTTAIPNQFRICTRQFGDVAGDPPRGLALVFAVKCGQSLAEQLRRGLRPAHEHARIVAPRVVCHGDRISRESNCKQWRTACLLCRLIMSLSVAVPASCGDDQEQSNSPSDG